ncbi:MAG: hypothetical protein M1816_006852 [Peltula sp. TS41687]|nr:MAG: hypothetical protein M1816_006852 [Peltula sp. TS41687]
MAKLTHDGAAGSQTSSTPPQSTFAAPPNHGHADIQDKDVDLAYKYLETNDVHAEGADEIDIQTLKRKIDWRIVPIMFACYTMQFIDKVLLNYAAVMGLPRDLHLKGNDFTNAATSFFIAYLIAEIPNGFFLQKVGVAKWLGANVMFWGVATACTAAAYNYASLTAARVMLGVFEAAIAPSLMLISSMYYTKSEQAPRFSFWYSGMGLGQILGGVVSYGFQKVHHPSIAGWRIMFIVLGVVTVIIGLVTFLFLPDTPMKARFLTEKEKVVLLRHVSVNQTGISNTSFKFSQFLEVLMDPQIWLMTMLTMLISVSSGVVTTYSATLIRNIGFSPPVSALLNMPSGIVSISATLIVGFGIRKTSHRWAWLAGCCIPGILGGGLMSFQQHNKAALLAGIYLVNSIVATLIIIYQWTIANCAGQTKRVVASALIAGSFSIGNIIGPQTFQQKDAPQYVPAKLTVLATQAAGAVMAMFLFFYYVFANAQKDREHGIQTVEGELSGEPNDAERWMNKTDKENTTFRYVY